MLEILGHVAVIGEGSSGPTIAVAPAERHRHVIVLDRDTLSREPGRRAGAPRRGQLRSLLGTGQRALDELPRSAR